MTNEQLLSIQFHAREVDKHAIAAYWKGGNTDFHEKIIKDNVDELIAILMEVHNEQRNQPKS